MNHIWLVEVQGDDGKWYVDEQTYINLTKKAAEKDKKNIAEVSPEGIKFRIKKYVSIK